MTQVEKIDAQLRAEELESRIVGNSIYNLHGKVDDEGDNDADNDTDDTDGNNNKINGKLNHQYHSVPSADGNTSFYHSKSTELYSRNSSLLKTLNTQINYPENFSSFTRSISSSGKPSRLKTVKLFLIYFKLCKF